MTNSLCQGNLPDDIEITFGGTDADQERTISVSNTGSVIVEELKCGNHEEADTRISAHISYACRNQSFRRVVVQTTDTDVVLLSMYHLNTINMLEELWIQRHDRDLPVHSVVQNLSSKYDRNPSELCECLLSVYVLTGCDSVSYIYI